MIYEPACVCLSAAEKGRILQIRVPNFRKGVFFFKLYVFDTYYHTKVSKSFYLRTFISFSLGSERFNNNRKVSTASTTRLSSVVINMTHNNWDTDLSTLSTIRVPTSNLLMCYRNSRIHILPPIELV